MKITTPPPSSEKSVSPPNQFFLAVLGIGVLVGTAPLALAVPLWTVYVAPFLVAPYLWRQLHGLHDQEEEGSDGGTARWTVADAAREHPAGTVSVRADDRRFDETVEAAVEEGRPLEIIFGDGSEIVAEPGAARGAQGQLPDVIPSQHRQTVIEKLPNDYLARLFAHPVRVRIMEILREEQASHLELSKELNISRSEAFYHLRKLEQAGLIEVAEVRPRRGETMHYYRVIDPNQPL